MAAILLPLPASAQDSESAALRGVWTGTMGGEPLHACFDGEGQGVFYLDRDFALIRLIEEKGGFFEKVGFDEPSGNRWRLPASADGIARGVRLSGGERQEVTLRPVDYEMRDEFAGPCGSAAFLEPRWRGDAVESEAKSLYGTTYTELRYIPPPHLRAGNDGESGDIAIQTFAIPETRPTDRAINVALAGYLPRGDNGDAFADCFATSIAYQGQDGYWSQTVAPEVIGYRWVVALESNGGFCGGAHPSFWQHRRVFDRNGGREADPESWLNDDALAHELFESGADSYVYTTTTEAFREAIRPYWQDEDPEFPCVDTAMDAQRWDIGLAREGLALIPELPHVAASCAATVVRPWAAAEPFLSLEGRAVRLSMEAAE